METRISGLFLPSIDGVEDPSSDHSILVDWIQEYAISGDITNTEINVPLRIKSVIRAHKSFPMLCPVLLKTLVQLNNVLAPTCDVETVFSWVNSSMFRLDFIYELLKLDVSEVMILRHLEFAIYRDQLLKIWPLFIQDSYRFLVPQYFTIACQVGLKNEVGRLVFQLGKYRIKKAINSLISKPVILSQMKSLIDVDLCDELQSLVTSYVDQQILHESLLKVLYDLIVAKRMENLVELVNIYPKSRLTLEELNECLNNGNDQRELLISTFINQLNTQLLIPSVGTTEIIAFYIKVIRCFLIIDHRGIILDKVARPIRKYLACRPDTISKIVDALLNSNPKTNPLIEIHQELFNSLSKTNRAQFSVDTQSFAKYLDWTPEPMEALPDFRIGKIDDIIDSFISIFDDKRLFVDEFVKKFSYELLTLQNVDYDKKIIDAKQKLEMLKKKLQFSDKFTGDEFNVADIMIHDVEASNSLDKYIHASCNKSNNIPIHGIFLSHMYWPTLTPVTGPKVMEKIPSAIVDSINSYSKQYQLRQHGRHLEFHADQSMARCNIEIAGETRFIKARVLDICVLTWFMENTKTEDGKWKAVKLGIVVVRLGLPLQAVKNALQFWKDQSILAETNGNWKINE